MAIVKADHMLQEVRLSFNAAGDVIDVTLVVSYALKDDVANEVLAPVGLRKSVWATLNPGEQVSLNALGRRFKALAATF